MCARMKYPPYTFVAMSVVIAGMCVCMFVCSRVLKVHPINASMTDDSGRSRKLCQYMDPKVLQEKRHFRYEKNGKQFVTMGSLLERQICVLCAMVCQQNAVSGTVSQADKRMEWKQNILKTPSDIINERLSVLQKPASCLRARKLLCHLLPNSNGFGSQLYHVTYCLMMAYITNRTMLLDSTPLKYGGNTWDEMFLPVSSCKVEVPISSIKSESRMDEILSSDAEIVIANKMEVTYPSPEVLYLSIPEDIAFTLTLVNDDPPAWWIGQFLNYIFRLRSEIETKLRKEVKMKFDGQVVGVHIRRGDKLRKEAKYHSVDEYMCMVDTFFNRDNIDRNLFLATDDTSVLREMEENYPSYSIISNHSNAEGAGKRQNSLFGIVHDLYLLSKSDFVVCTITSNVCRVLYGLLLARGDNVTETFKTVDGIFFFKDKKETRHVYISRDRYSSNTVNHLNMSVGDIIERKYSYSVLMRNDMAFV